MGRTREPSALDSYANVGAGAFAGFWSTVITNPFDVLRVRLAASRDATGQTHKTLTHHLKLLFGDGILAGFRVALAANLACSMPCNAVYLSTYRNVTPTMKRNLGENTGTLAAAITSVVATNMSCAALITTRTRIQIDSNERIRDVMKGIYRKEGFRGFYRGAGVNTAGRAFEESIFWLLYEYAKRQTNQGTVRGGSMMWNIGAILGLSAWCKAAGTFISYPYNVVMTHLREVDKVTKVHKHTQVLPTIRYIYAKDGVAGFYKGVLPQMLRSMPSKAVQMTAFEFAVMMYNYAKYGEAHSAPIG